MKSCEFTKFLQQSLTYCPRSLVALNKFFGFWSSKIVGTTLLVLEEYIHAWSSGMAKFHEFVLGSRVIWDKGSGFSAAKFGIHKN